MRTNHYREWRGRGALSSSHRPGRYIILFANASVGKGGGGGGGGEGIQSVHYRNT